MKLPTPPSLEEIRAHVTKFGPVSAADPRPFWSVMIPTYNSGDLLRRTLESVLCQDPGVGLMQIEVVDGGSTADDPELIVNELGAARVAFHRMPENRGSSTTFNTCIDRARGQWIHILHGDDVVLPGFYSAYAEVIEEYPKAETVVGQALVFDEEDVWKGIEGPRPPKGGGILENFVDLVATEWLVLAPAMIVKRTAYEAVGGFCTLFKGSNDCELYMRLGLHSPVACVARPYALYRRQAQSQSKVMTSTGANVVEEWHAVATNLARIDAAARPRPTGAKTWRAKHAKRADVNAGMLNALDNPVGRYNQARWALVLDPTLRRFATFLRSWMRRKLHIASSLVGRSGNMTVPFGKN